MMKHRVCKHCGKDFETTYGMKKYCSEACRVASAIHRDSRRSKELMKDRKYAYKKIKEVSRYQKKKYSEGGAWAENRKKYNREYLRGYVRKKALEYTKLILNDVGFDEQVIDGLMKKYSAKTFTCEDCGKEFVPKYRLDLCPTCADERSRRKV